MKMLSAISLCNAPAAQSLNKLAPRFLSPPAPTPLHPANNPLAKKTLKSQRLMHSSQQQQQHHHHQAERLSKQHHQSNPQNQQAPLQTHTTKTPVPMNEIETFYGVVETTADALRIFQLCRQGHLGRVRRRLHEKERHLIRSGSVFVFDEQESGIKRWTDGRLWSPSRILGNFLIYRELDHRKSSAEDSTTDQSQELSFESVSQGLECSRKRTISYPLGSAMLNSASSSSLGGGAKRKFAFKENGLIKKTISITMQGHTHHLICYYTKRDHIQGTLPGTGWQELHATLDTVEIPPDLLTNQSFRKAGADEIYKRSSLLEDEGSDDSTSIEPNSFDSETRPPSFVQKASGRPFLHSFTQSTATSGMRMNAPFQPVQQPREFGQIQLSVPPLNPAPADLFWGSGTGDLESEFGHIAATLSKLAPSAVNAASSIKEPGAKLPPITGEAFSGNLPPLFLLPQATRSPIAAGETATQPSLTVNPIVDELLEQEYYRGLELFKAGPATVKTPSPPASSHPLLSLPMFPVEGGRIPAVGEYEETLKNALFGSGEQ
jgi:hypothetical protein